MIKNIIYKNNIFQNPGGYLALVPVDIADVFCKTDYNNFYDEELDAQIFSIDNKKKILNI